MALQSINVNIRRSNTPANTQDLTAYPLIIGDSSAGPINTPTVLNRLSDCSQFESGAGIEHAAANVDIAGGPVLFVRATTSTPSTLSAVVKTPGAQIGTATPSFGSVIIPGATSSGDVLITAKALNVTLTIVDPGAVLAASTIVVAGTDIVVTLKHGMAAITETGTGLAALINGNVAAAALVTAVAQMGGAGIAGPLVLTSLNQGALSIAALTTGISYQVVLSGNNTVFATAFASNTVTVTLGTDANGEPTTLASTALASLTALAASNPGKFTVGAIVPPGSLLLGAKTLTALAFGSSGTLTIAGVPSDKYTFVFEIVKGGTIGGLTPVIGIWSCDGVNYTSQTSGVLPPTGISLLKDAFINTNVTVTLSGTFDVGDKFTFTSTAPVVSPSDLIAALDSAIAWTGTQEFGYIATSVPVDKATLAIMDGRVQAAFNNKFVNLIANTRDRNVGESALDWKSAIINDFAGFVSPLGLSSRSDGWIMWNSPLSLRRFRRPLLFFVTSRYSSIPMHESLSKFASETAVLNNVLEIYHDEYLDPGLDSQRGITSRTYDIAGTRGAKYISRGVTLADANDQGSVPLHWVRMKLAVCYNVKKYLFRYLGTQLQTIRKAESVSIPIGALKLEEANKIKNGVLGIMKSVLESRKSDGSISAYVTPDDVQVPRNYNLLQTKELIINGSFTPFADVEKITFSLGLILSEADINL